MSLYTHIEKEIENLGSTRFQQLCDQYLRRFRYSSLISSGIAVGAEKDVTGVPDAHAVLSDGRYVLIGYTTVQGRSKLKQKLLEDLAECLNPAKTGIALAQIEHIILGCNSRPNAATVQCVRERGQLKGREVEVFSIDQLMGLVQQYPSLATQHLGLSIGSGQLMHATDYIQAYGRQTLATPLTHVLYGREQESEKLKQAIGNPGIVLLAGATGVGKTQLALTICQDYCAENPTTRQLLCVYDTGAASFQEELNHHLVPDKETVVFVDDANRVLAHLKTLVAYQRARPAGMVRIVATVREYACAQVKQAIQVVQFEELRLKQLTDEALSKLLEASPYGIKHYKYLEKILQIANGNPRLAIMAAQAAVETQCLDRLYKIGDIYDEYFRAFREEMEKTPILLNVMALVAFFRVVHRKDEELGHQIEKVFGISALQFWEAVHLLNEAELVNLHDGRTVKPADQILSQYVFYKVFLEWKRLSYNSLLVSFFAKYSGRVDDALRATVNDFGYENVEPLVKPSLQVWLQQNSEESWRFFEVFWLYLRVEALAQVRRYLAGLPEPTLALADYVAKEPHSWNRLRNHPALNVLNQFVRQAINELPQVLWLMLELGRKLPEQFSKVIYYLQEATAFDDEHYEESGLWIEEQFFKVALAGLSNPSTAAYHRMALLHCLPAHLNLAYRKTRPGGKRNSMRITSFKLPYADAVQELREKFWRTLFAQYSAEPVLVVAAIKAYTESYLYDAEPTWLVWDAERLLPFLQSHLDAHHLGHCKLVLAYCRRIERYDVQLPLRMKVVKQFSSAEYRLYQRVAVPRWAERSSYVWRRNKQRLFPQRLTAAKSVAAYLSVFERTSALQPHLTDDERRHSTDSLDILLRRLIKRDRAMGGIVLKYIIERDNELSIVPRRALRAFAQATHAEYKKGFALLSQPGYPGRNDWEIEYLQHIPRHLLERKWLDALYAAFDRGVRWCHFRDLTAYESLDEALYPRLLTAALKTAQGQAVSFERKLCERYGSYFQQHPQVLIDFYLWRDKQGGYFDSQGEELQAVIQIAPAFLMEYVISVSQQHDWNDASRDRRSFSFLWQQEEWQRLVSDVFEIIVSHPSLHERKLLKSLFPSDMAGEKMLTRMSSFIEECIRHHHSDERRMKLLFYIIRKRFPDLLFYYVEQLLPLAAATPEVLKALPLLPSSRSGGGGFVQMHQDDHKVWDTLLMLIAQQEQLSGGLLEYQQFVFSSMESGKEMMKTYATWDFESGE